MKKISKRIQIKETLLRQSYKYKIIQDCQLHFFQSILRNVRLLRDHILMHAFVTYGFGRDVTKMEVIIPYVQIMLYYVQ